MLTLLVMKYSCALAPFRLQQNAKSQQSQQRKNMRQNVIEAFIFLECFSFQRAVSIVERLTLTDGDQKNSLMTWKCCMSMIKNHLINHLIVKSILSKRLEMQMNDANGTWQHASESNQL
jgi:hypothetical protein